MRVLVTGSTGQIGHEVRRQLAMHPFIQGTFTSSQHHEQTVLLNVADEKQFERVVDEARPEAIVHLAARTTVDSQHTNDLHEVNVGSVGTLVRVASSARVKRIIFSSSAAVYGDKRIRRVSEDDPPQPLSPYGLSKLEAERTLESLHLRNDLIQTVALRIFNVFGGRNSPSLVSRLIASTPTNPVPLVGPDNFVRDYVHVSDVGRAIVMSLTARLGQPHSVFNVGTGIPTSNRTLIETLSKRGMVHHRQVDGPASYSCADATRARALLHFEARRRI